MHKQTLIIFDLVATLTDASPRYVEAYMRICRSYDITPPDKNDILQALGNMNLKQIIKNFTPDLPEDQVGAFMQDCNQACDLLLYDVYWHEDLYPDVRETLQTLSKQGVEMGIYTGTREDALESQLRYHNLLPYFNRAFVRAKNNDRDGFLDSNDLKAAQLRSIISFAAGQYETILVVGDSKADFQAASKAGLPFIGFAPDTKKAAALRDAGTQTLFSAYTELPDIIAAYTMRPAHAAKRQQFQKNNPA